MSSEVESRLEKELAEMGVDINEECALWKKLAFYYLDFIQNLNHTGEYCPKCQASRVLEITLKDIANGERFVAND